MNRTGNILPVDMTHVCNTDAKHGKPSYNGEFRYLVEGVKMPYREIRARVPEAVSDATLRNRLKRHYSNTIESLSMSVAEANRIGYEQAGIKNAHGRIAKRLYAEAHAARRAKQREGHKPL